jgi:hypothetical protein
MSKHKVIGKCSRCGADVTDHISNKKYFGYCTGHDEDLFEFEFWNLREIELMKSRKVSDIGKLNRRQLNRLYYVHNTIHKMLIELSGTEIEWDMHYIGRIADIAQEQICGKLKVMPEMEFMPYNEEVKEWEHQ